MADKSSIEWTDATWNPVAGCSIISQGCTNCYAMKMAARIEAMGSAPHYAGLTTGTKAGAVWTGEIAVAPDSILTQPLRWKHPRRIFVNSMSDLFHEGVPDEAIDKVFAVMALCPQHTFQVLTKRATRMRTYVSRRTGDWQNVLPDAFAPGTLPITKNQVERTLGRAAKLTGDPPTPTWPLSNVWLGVSTEDQPRADERIPELLATPAAKRFLSCEPLLGPLAMDGRNLVGDETYWNWLKGERGPSVQHIAAKPEQTAKIDWVIVGGESGPRSRPFALEWARNIISQCQTAGVACFVKQLGAKPGDRQSPQFCHEPIRLKDRKGGDWSEWPEDLRVREFPT